MKTILIVDDDCYISDMLCEALTNEGYGVLRAFSGTEALLLLEKRSPDLIILDLMLPGMSGEELLPKIKCIPTIVVSAKIGIESKVNSLLGGAVDYVTKPFELKELLARIFIRLRKSEPNAEHLHFDEIDINLKSHSVHVGEVTLKLTPIEYAILKILVENNGMTISKSAILDGIMYQSLDCSEGSLKIHVSNLRKKIKAVNGKDMIEAIWGIGFRLKE
jgi:DNA-binding response OmpR family regulator